MSDAPSTPQASSEAPSAPPPNAGETKSQGSETKEQNATAPQAGDKTQEKTSKPLPPAPKMRKVVIDGKEELVDEEAVFRDYQKYRAGDKLLKEAAMTKKQTQEFVKALRENPRAVLSNPHLGIDARKLAEEILREDIEAELEDPKERRLKELERYKEERDAKEEEERTTAEQREWEDKVNQEREAIATKLHKVLENTALAKDAATLRAAAYYMKQCLARGVAVEPEDIVTYLEGHQLGNYRATALQYEGEQLVKFLGEDVVKRIRDYDMAQLKAKRAEKAELKQRTDPPPPREPKNNYIDRYAASEMARKKLLGG